MSKGLEPGQGEKIVRELNKVCCGSIHCVAGIMHDATWLENEQSWPKAGQPYAFLSATCIMENFDVSKTTFKSKVNLGLFIFFIAVIALPGIKTSNKCIVF
ncbi:MAG TPA: hypothetical protein VKQ08_04925 [Cyclobacteriaceae bacterium]|nr:hypothetical protein [Cyclobacteriaceae bacterium]